MHPTTTTATDELARVLAHLATLHPRHAPEPPCGAPLDTPGACLGCQAPKGYHFTWCAHRGASDAEIEQLRTHVRRRGSGITVRLVAAHDDADELPAVLRAEA